MVRVDRKPRPVAGPPSWPGGLLVAAGLLTVVLWPVYITLHGATSFNRGGRLWGQGPEFWGAMMEGPSNLLIALSLFGLYRLLAGRPNPMTRVGFALVVAGLTVTGLADIVLRAIAPPLLSPLVATGLILLAIGHRANAALPRLGRFALWAMGLLLWFSVLWTALLPLAVFDRINGYVVFGIAANVLVGFGWILFGASLRGRRRVG